MDVIFTTTGQLELTALNAFGVNSKPNSDNPIGYFGTGLKYAIAVLLRNGCEIKIYTGPYEISFFLKTEMFRQKPIERIYLLRNKRKFLLPFTTDLGKNWELWQAFRELYSNTLDEKGNVKAAEFKERTPGCTHIVVSGQKFVEEFDRRFEHTFLEEGINQTSVVGVQVLPRESKAVYYRGIRVLELEKPSACTYNILSKLELTEDRTAKNFWEILFAIKTALLTTNDEEVLNIALNCNKQYLEHGIDFTGHWLKPSTSFLWAGNNSINISARKVAKQNNPDWIAAQEGMHFTQRMVCALNDEDYDRFKALVDDYKDEFINLLNSYNFADTHPESEQITREEQNADF